MEPVTSAAIAVTINGDVHERDVDVRRLLVHFVRDDLGLTGTHVGCDTGNCGACTVLFDGAAVEGAEFEPPDDVHASADYRRHLAAVCAVRAVRQATERGRH